MEIRKIDIAVISDVHLGTYGCRSNELCSYLTTIEPDTLILNGDIIDIWQFNKKFWPVGHMQVIKQITTMLSRGVKVYYVTGNHDEMLRRFENFSLGNFHIVNKLVINHTDNKRSWIFHGDVFDVIMQHSRWLAKLGAVGYDMLIYINAFINYCSKNIGKGKISLSKKIKNSVKGAIKHINNFEETAAAIAIDRGYDYVVCGHIHQPCNRTITNNKGSVTYLNSGDWIENLTALEYAGNKWELYHFHQDETIVQKSEKLQKGKEIHLRTAEIFKIMMEDFVNTSK